MSNGLRKFWGVGGKKLNKKSLRVMSNSSNYKYDIFFSYSRADAQIVDYFKRLFEHHGFKVWMDVDGIDSGEAFKGVIANAIEESALVVFFSSYDSNVSEWTAKEIGYAVNVKKPIIPVILDDSKFNNKEVAFDLSRLDYINYANIDIRRQELNRLIRAIKKYLASIDSPLNLDPPVPPKKRRKFWRLFWKWFGLTWSGFAVVIFVVGIVALILRQCKKSDSTSNVPAPIVIKDAVTDIEGNTYDAVKIGDQIWMAENMRATLDRDGNEIILGNEYPCANLPYRYFSPDRKGFVKEYGYLYNWTAATKVCPKGWHLPVETEWVQLQNYLKSSSCYLCDNCDTCYAKSLASTKDLWYSGGGKCTVGSNTSENNTTGFNARAAGIFYISEEGTRHFDDNTAAAYFWSDTKVSDYSYLFYLSADSPTMQPLPVANSYSIGCSVRCVKDE